MKTTLAALAPEYDGFLIDQFGVLLNGQGAYEAAPRTLCALAAMGKEVILLSNSGKRAAPNEARLTRLGFDRASYKSVLSSGEAAFAEIGSRIGKDIAANSAVWVHSRDGDLSPVEGLPLRCVDDPGAADLLIIAGSRGDTFTLAQYRNWLAPAAARRVPAFCTNPDMAMLTPTGQCFGAGAIAQLFEDLGGAVEWVGKPYPLIYRIAHDMLGAPDRSRVLCIGDSPAHDILGGRDAGFATALVRTGLHADLSDDALLTLCKDTALPDYVIAGFSMEGRK
jgi:HAD superfamily hydrolase (TIGR01459 family)